MSAVTDGYSAAFLGAGAIAVACAVVASMTLRRPPATQPTADVQQTDDPGPPSQLPNADFSHAA